MRAVVVAAFLLLAAGTPAPASAQLTLTASQPDTARLSTLTFSTPAVPGGTTTVRVLLPDGYAVNPNRRYPVLYLLHGGAGSSGDWTTAGNAVAATAGKPLIVVMPDGGAAGWYSNWRNAGTQGKPRWEDYHVDELIPWVDGHLRTVASRKGRAIAGLSMGGFGAMSYAARHPDLFTAAAAFSGAVDTAVQPQALASLAALDGGSASSIWGARKTEEIVWRGHNPTDLAENLRGMQVTLRTGNGKRGGPFGGGGPDDPFEPVVHEMTVNLHERLAAYGVPSIYEDYGPGGHTWAYWNRDLEQTLPAIIRTFDHPRVIPSDVRFVSTAPRYAVRGWTVAIHRKALEFSRLSGATARGFDLAGSGTATVVTPGRYRPRSAHAVTIKTEKGAVTRTTRRADAQGRLRIALPLGPVNKGQQDAPGVKTRFWSTSVRIR